MGTDRVAGSLGSLVICPPLYRLGGKGAQRGVPSSGPQTSSLSGDSGGLSLSQLLPGPGVPLRSPCDPEGLKGQIWEHGLGHKRLLKLSFFPAELGPHTEPPHASVSPSAERLVVTPHSLGCRGNGWVRQCDWIISYPVPARLPKDGNALCDPAPGWARRGCVSCLPRRALPQVWPPSTGLRAEGPQVHGLAWPLRSPGCAHRPPTCQAHCRRGSSAPCRPLPTLAPHPTLLCLPRGVIWGEATLLSLPLTPLLVFARFLQACLLLFSSQSLPATSSSRKLSWAALSPSELHRWVASALALPRHLKRVSLRSGWEFSPRVTLASGLEF